MVRNQIEFRGPINLDGKKRKIHSHIHKSQTDI